MRRFLDPMQKGQNIALTGDDILPYFRNRVALP
jgi:hypothetical protein